MCESQPCEAPGSAALYHLLLLSIPPEEQLQWSRWTGSGMIPPPRRPGNKTPAPCRFYHSATYISEAWGKRGFLIPRRALPRSPPIKIKLAFSSFLIVPDTSQGIFKETKAHLQNRENSTVVPGVKISL
ncbi:hypothetical protein AAFF_G00223530 [Aldrovandia affinis]|uniref:Uncharacterized protein n=1 Tax=Aldrovandia affinis TaxID=143900 RepID=A0AAD7X248_9TELE|nr:hypothetical protein AAFF_G00223530 [Aldrovandia affinis]